MYTRVLLIQSIRPVALFTIVCAGIFTTIGSSSSGDGDGDGVVIDDEPSSRTVSFTARPDFDWVAFQDGSDSDWTQVSPDEPGGQTYSLPITSTDGKFGIAFHMTGSAQRIHVIQATYAEFPEFNAGSFLNEYEVSVNVNNIIEGNTATVSISNDSEDFSNIQPGPKSLSVSEGIHDLVAIEHRINEPNRGIIQRDLSITAPTNITIDFATQTNVSSFTPHNINVTARGNYYGDVLFITDNHTSNSAIKKQDVLLEGYYALTEGVIPGDLYSMAIRDDYNSDKSRMEIRRNFPAETDPGDVNFDFTQIYPLVNTLVHPDYIAGLNYIPNSSSPDLVAYRVDYEQVRSSDRLEWTIYISSAWLGEAGSYDRPDFSTVTGFLPTWDFTDSDLVKGRIGAGMANTQLTSLLSGVEFIPNLLMHVTSEAFSFTPNVVEVDTNVEWIAFQDGANNPWQAATADTDGIYRRTIVDPHGKYGVAMAYQDATGRHVDLIQSTLAEYLFISHEIAPTHTINLTVSNIGAYGGEATLISMDNDFVLAQVPQGDTYQMNLVREGLRDLVVYEITTSPYPATGILIERDIPISSDMSVSIDLQTATPNINQFSARNFTVIGGTFSGGHIHFTTKNGTLIFLGDQTTGWSALEQGTVFEDVYSFAAVGVVDISENYVLGAYRSVSAALPSADQTLDLSNIMVLTGTSVDSTDASGLNYIPSTTSQRYLGYFVDLRQVFAPSNELFWQQRITPGWLGSDTTYQRQEQGLLSAGLPQDYSLASGTTAFSEITALTANLPAALYIFTPPNIQLQNQFVGGLEKIPGLEVEFAMETHEFTP